METGQFKATTSPDVYREYYQNGLKLGIEKIIHYPVKSFPYRPPSLAIRALLIQLRPVQSHQFIPNTVLHTIKGSLMFKVSPCVNSIYNIWNV